MEPLPHAPGNTDQGACGAHQQRDVNVIIIKIAATIYEVLTTCLQWTGYFLYIAFLQIRKQRLQNLSKVNQARVRSSWSGSEPSLLLAPWQAPSRCQRPSLVRS